MPVAPRVPDDKLYVVCAVSNPVRFESRFKLYQRFAKEMKAAGVQLVTVEAAFGERPHETPALADSYGQHILLRSSEEIWQKEALLNVGISRLPADWEYCAWVDADISFLRPDWVGETLEALQHFPVVQMFQTAIDCGPTGAAMNTYTGYAESFVRGLPYGPGAGGSYGPYWHSGFAHAARREAIEELGGLLDFGILGAGDHHMALSLLGRAHVSLPGGVNKNYADMVYAWQERAKAAHLTGNVGPVKGSIAHHWHGSKTKRRYVERWNVLTKFNFDPLLDIKRDSQGLWQLTKRGYRMRNQLRAYFFEREEDGLDL
jgi:hypothetical protein